MELEHLRLTEVDAEGRIRASIRFDPDDRAEAFAEAYTRFAAGEAAGGGHTPIAAFVHAIARRDWEGMRRLCEGMSLHDHRPLSFGELRGEQWVESLRVQDELAPDWQSNPLHILAWNRHGRVGVGRRFGTLRDGGPFETFFLELTLSEGDRVSRHEVFEVSDVEHALARFEEFCAGRA